MALIDEVRTRVSSQRRIELTNTDVSTATTEDATVLAAACTDTEAAFVMLVGREFDSTDARHVRVAVYGVLYHLNLWRGINSPELQPFEERWEKSCEDLRKVTFNNRIRPTSNSVLTVSPEQVNDETVRPDFDRPNFNGLTPAPPTGGSAFSPDERR